MSGRKPKVASKAERMYIIHHLTNLATEQPKEWGFLQDDLLSLAEAGPTRAWDKIAAQVLDREQQDDFEKFISSWLWSYWNSKNHSPEFEPFWSFWDSRWSSDKPPAKPAFVSNSQTRTSAGQGVASPARVTRSGRVAPSERVDSGALRLDLLLTAVFMLVGWTTFALWFFNVNASQYGLSDRSRQWLLCTVGVLDILAAAIGLLSPGFWPRLMNVGKSTFAPLDYIVWAFVGTGLLAAAANPGRYLVVLFGVALYKFYCAALLTQKWVARNAGNLALGLAGIDAAFGVLLVLDLFPRDYANRNNWF